MSETEANDFTEERPPALADNPDACWEVRAWLGLGLLALAVAGLFAPVLALSRVPGAEDLVPWPLHAFEKGLVVHVIYSFVVWFLCLLATLAVALTYWMDGGRTRGRGTGRSAVWVTAIAFVMLAWPALKHDTEPSLNNYVPVIIDPLYYLGLAFLFMGVLFVVFRLVAAFFRRQYQPGAEGLGVLMTALAYVAALICFGLTFSGAGKEPASVELNERLFWGGGHVLQFVNLGLMAASWYALALFVGRPIRDGVYTFAMAALAIFAFAGPLIYAVTEMYSARQTQLFTDLQYLLAPTAVILAGAVLTAGRSGGDTGAEGRLARRALYLSFAVFFLGALFGLFVDGADTRTPAHYHGVIGGVNLGLMGLILLVILPTLGRGVALTRPVFALFWLYGVGQALHSAGLFLAGGYGAPRKVAGDVAGLETLGAQAGLYGMGLGAVIAVIGGVMFIVIVGRALLGKPIPTDTGNDRELKI